jgi:hypothetical protein
VRIVLAFSPLSVKKWLIVRCSIWILDESAHL